MWLSPAAWSRIGLPDCRSAGFDLAEGCLPDALAYVVHALREPLGQARSESTRRPPHRVRFWFLVGLAYS